MVIMVDALFFLSLIGFISAIIFGANKFPRNLYNLILLAIVFVSSSLTILFYEFDIELSNSTPLHTGLLAFAQYGVVTLASKIWFSLNYSQLGKVSKFLINFIIFGSLFTLIIANYWVKSINPVYVLLIYPLASLSLSLIAENIEEKCDVNRR